MPTKAELEAELAEMRALLAERSPSSEPADSAPQEAGREPEAEEPHDFQTHFGTLLKEFESAAEKNPAMALMGAFIVGLVIGRAVGR